MLLLFMDSIIEGTRATEFNNGTPRNTGRESFVKQIRH